MGAHSLTWVFLLALLSSLSSSAHKTLKHCVLCALALSQCLQFSLLHINSQREKEREKDSNGGFGE